MKRIIIIGGGASGLVTAINAKTPNNEVILLEKNDKCGKKILVTGNGKCNYFNEDFNIAHYKSDNIDVLSNTITPNNKEKILNFWDKLGIVPKIKNNYYYPLSNLAVTIQNTLILEAKFHNVDIITNCEVLDIEYKNNKYLIKTTTTTFESDILVLATGSKAAPNTGSTGFAYDIVKNFNHTIIPPLPALCSLKAEGKFLKDWSGIRTDVKVSLYENNKFIEKESGEIQLTDYGVSGICIFQLSRTISRGLYNNKKEKIKIDFIPNINTPNINSFIEYLDSRNNKLKNRNILELLEGLLNYKLVLAILKEANIKHTLNLNKLTDIEKRNLYHKIKEFSLDITDTSSYNKAQVCSGGIPLTEINISTMESLKQKDLYLVGELLDVDGECGGFNLGFAWLSGILAGNNISGDKND
jgi:predicted Rossmann fold flavoprotein